MRFLSPSHVIRVDSIRFDRGSYKARDRVARSILLSRVSVGKRCRHDSWDLAGFERWSDTSTINIIIPIPSRGSDKLDPHTTHKSSQAATGNYYLTRTQSHIYCAANRRGAQSSPSLHQLSGLRPTQAGEHNNISASEPPPPPRLLDFLASKPSYGLALVSVLERHVLVDWAV